MRLRVNAIYELIGSHFKGNIADFCRTLGVSYSTGWRVLNNKSSANVKFIPAIITYCKQHNLDISKYIEI